MANRQDINIDMQNAQNFDRHLDTDILHPNDLGENIPRDPSIRDWTIPAIFSTLWCCCSVGLCATYYAIRANYNYDKGYLKTARQHTVRAKTLTLVAITIGSVVLVICIIVMAVLISRAMSFAYDLQKNMANVGSYGDMNGFGSGYGNQ